MSSDELTKTDYMGETLTIGQLKTRLHLAEMSNSALMAKLEKVQRISRDRLRRMRQRGKLLIQTRASELTLREQVELKAQAGLCSMSFGGARAFLEDIQDLVRRKA